MRVYIYIYIYKKINLNKKKVLHKKIVIGIVESQEKNVKYLN